MVAQLRPEVPQRRRGTCKLHVHCAGIIRLVMAFPETATLLAALISTSSTLSDQKKVTHITLAAQTRPPEGASKPCSRAGTLLVQVSLVKMAHGTQLCRGIHIVEESLIELGEKSRVVSPTARRGGFAWSPLLPSP